MSNSIAILIERGKFTKNEIFNAIHGECMWFAIALNDILISKQIKSNLVVATNPTSPEAQWAHVLVQHRDSYYDIRGKVVAEDVHKEFSTSIMRNSTRTKLIDRCKSTPLLDHRIEYWNNRLRGFVTWPTASTF